MRWLCRRRAAAARWGESGLAEEFSAYAESLFEEIVASPYRDLCLESLHRAIWFSIRHATETAETHRAVREAATRRMQATEFARVRRRNEEVMKAAMGGHRAGHQPRRP